MTIAPLASVKAKLSAYIRQCEAQGPVLITRNGKAVAVMIAPQDDQELERLIVAHSPRLQALLGKSRQSIKAGKGLTRAAFWRAVKHRCAKAK
jgi:prevent-host-death family protein